MGLPGHRRTSSHKRRRAAHFALVQPSISVCEKCGKSTLPHRACKSCGFYRGREVVNTTRQVSRLLKRTKKATTSPTPSTEKHDHDHDHKES